MEIRLLDVATQRVLNQKTLGPVTTVTEIATALPGLAQELVAPLLKDQQGYLLVRTREEAAEVLVDDTLAGSTPLKAPLTLSRGTHRVQVRKDGFIAQTRSVRIEPNQTRVEDVDLVPSPDYAAAYRDKNGRARVGAWIATGVAVVSISAAIWLDVAAHNEYNNEFYPRQQWLLGASGQGSQVKPPSMASNPTASANWDSCTQQGAKACSAAPRRAPQSDVKTLSWLTAGTAVVAVAATSVAVWLWVSGEDRRGRLGRRRRRRANARWRNDVRPRRALLSHGFPHLSPTEPPRVAPFRLSVGSANILSTLLTPVGGVCVYTRPVPTRGVRGFRAWRATMSNQTAGMPPAHRAPLDPWPSQPRAVAGLGQALRPKGGWTGRASGGAESPARPQPGTPESEGRPSSR